MASVAISTMLVLAPMLLLLRRASACTAVGITAGASASGYPMVGHSEDSGPMTNDIRLVRVPRQRWPEGSQRPLYVWRAGYPRIVSTELRTPDYEAADGQQLDAPLAYIPQVSETWAYWDTDYAVQNEWGLSIGESTCTARTVGWPANKPYGYNRVGIEDLTKLALERCKTARCAVETMGQIAVEQGFYSADSGDPKAPAYGGSSECLLVADAGPGELWSFNVMTGKNNASAIWAAQRVPDGHVIALANAYPIRKMNLSDSRNFLYSPKVSALAEEMGWWSPKQEASTDIFDFFGAYGYTPSVADVPPPYTAEFMTNVLNYYSGRRIWRIFNLLSPSEGAKLDPSTGNLPHAKDPYPFSVPAPRHSITERRVMDVYRDHYEGTPYDLTVGMAAGPFGNPNRANTALGVDGLWERAIAMYRTTWSFVLEPKPRGRSLTWFGWDAPHGTAYLPLFGAASADAPDSYHSRDGHMSKFSNKVAFWAFNMVNQYQDLHFDLINGVVLKRAHQVEEQGAHAVALWNEEADRAADDTEAVALLTRRSNAFVDARVGDWWEFGFSLFAKYGHYVETHNESDIGTTILRYPEWWLKSPEVGFTEWNPRGPYHGVVLDAESSTYRKAALRAMQKDLSRGQTSDVAFPTCLMLLCLIGSVLVAYQLGMRQGRRSTDATAYYLVQP